MEAGIGTPFLTIFNKKGILISVLYRRMETEQKLQNETVEDTDGGLQVKRQRYPAGDL